MKTQSVNPPSERRGAVGRSLRRLVRVSLLLPMASAELILCLSAWGFELTGHRKQAETIMEFADRLPDWGWYLANTPAEGRPET